MKKMIVMLMTAILAVAMIGCGNDAGAGNRSSSDQTADEALESLNEEINAMIEAEQREEEERAQRAEEGYPEGVIPEGEYVCRDLLDEESDIYIDEFILSSLTFYSEGGYLYDEGTKRYTKFCTPNGGLASRYWHHVEGFLNDEGNFVVTYYARYDKDILYETVGTITGEIENNRFEEEHPEVANVVLDDIEWVYVFQTE